ncbi:putative NAD(P)H-binding [Lyophyllum shimeji]|uniref:NAD(P)H-binding n=1 Tax=Lyophyllum shimeji TaxID=47721 RepID=A0A9P3UK00_LYOSH|nr:putative NAD(P)H-binding [Lyophyllum shimeji]
MPHKVVVCGAGFLGTNIARNVAASRVQRPQIQLSSRNPDKIHKVLQHTIPSDRLLPPVPLDVTNPSTLPPAFSDANVVVSLVGVMHGSPKDFEDIQLRGAENVANAVKDVGAKLIHFSAIGADPQSDIPYWRTKGLAEDSILRICPDATILRPSLVFGPEDDFFNRFSRLSKYLPVLPVFGGGRALLQPVYVGDVARAVEILSRDDPDVRKETAGKIIEAGGPDVFTFRQLMELVLKYNHRYRPIISLPFQVGMLQGAVLERLPVNLFTITRSQVKQLQADNIVNPAASAGSISFKDLLEKFPHLSPGDNVMPNATDDKTDAAILTQGESTASTDRPFSVFTKREKWFIVGLISFAGIFSPLTANVYFPAIPAISIAFNKSTELINLTVTMYMVMQGIAPMYHRDRCWGYRRHLCPQRKRRFPWNIHSWTHDRSCYRTSNRWSAS